MEGSTRQRKPQSANTTNSAQFTNAYLQAKYQDVLRQRLKRKTPLSIRLTRYLAVLVAVLALLSRYHSFLKKTEDHLLVTPGKLIQIDADSYFHLHCHNPTDGSDYSKNPTVILVHGIAGNSLEWQLVTKEISRHVRVCTIDRGIFTLFRFNESRNCTALSHEMDAILQTASIDPPYVLVGHSSGGLLVQHYAYTHPEKVSGLVLVDTSHEDQNDKIFNHMFLSPMSIANAFIGVCKYLSGFGFVRLLGYFHLVSFPPTHLYPSEHVANILYSDPVMWVRADDELSYLGESLDIMRNMRTTHEFKENLPIVVITALDRSAKEAEPYKEMHALLAALSKNGHHVMAAHAGHYVQLQQPEIVNNAILEVLQKNGYTIE